MLEKKNIILKDNTLFVQNHTEEILAIMGSDLTPPNLLKRLKAYHEKDIAEVFPLLTYRQRERLYLVLGSDFLADIFEYCENVEVYLKELNVSAQISVLSQMETQNVQDYLQGLTSSERTTLLELMGDNYRKNIMLLNSFDDEEIGSRMSTNYVKIAKGITVREAMHRLIEQAAENDNISTIYVVEDDGVFSGAIELKSLIIARDTTPLEEITMSSYPYVYGYELIEDCIERLRNYSEDTIPILSKGNMLIGVITANDIAEMSDEQISEDYAKLAGLSCEEDLHEPLIQSVKKRIPWLIVLMALGLLVSTVVGLFEEVIAQLTIIISFQSLILDMAGNVGTQSLAVTIRVLMDNGVSGKEKLKLVLKESKVGLTNGLLLGLLSVLFISLYLVLLKGQTFFFATCVAMCIAIALLVSIFFSSVCGTTIPMLFQIMKVDPAVASGPLITTLNDLIAVVTYYGLAWLLLIQVLHL